MKQKYTAIQEEEMAKRYNACETDEEREELIEDLAEKYNKTKRMIIAKLSKMENVRYVRKTTVSKVLNGPAQTKAQMIERIEQKFGAIPGQLESMQNCSKLVLKFFIEV